MNAKSAQVGKIRDAGCIFEWDIENYAKLSAGKNADFYFTSPSFETLAGTWNLYLYPSTLNYYSTRYISIYLEKKCSEVKEHQMIYKLELKVKESILRSFSEPANFKGNSRYGLKEFFNASNHPRLETQDTVTVILHMYPKECTIQQVKSHTVITAKTSEGVNLLSTNMKNLYLNQQDCDFTIRVKTQEFKVHKAILGAQSPVLYSMLHADMAEQNTGIVDIVDSEPHIFQNFLLYLYTGQVEGLSWKNVTQLFMLGDKYDLQYLKKECRKYMLHHICQDGFCDVVVLAVDHNDLELLKCAENYFLKNAKSIISSKKWQEFLYENPTVCNELFLKYVTSHPPASI